MAMTVAVGGQSYSGTYIPEIWSPKLLVKFYANSILPQICNTDYEGEIKAKGDKVIIRNVPDITVRDYVVGQELTYEQLAPTNTELLIDKAKYFAFSANDVVKRQSDIKFVNKWSEDGSMQMKIAIETAAFAYIYGQAATYNKGTTAGYISQDINLGTSGTPVTVTKDNILDIIVDMGTCLDEYNVPATDRALVIPPWMAGMLKKSDLKDASLTGDSTSVLRGSNERLGSINGFTLYLSNLIHNSSGNFDVFACHKSGFTFATQITENEMVRNQKDFGDFIRALQVYGYKVIKPESVVHLYCTKG